MRSFFASSNNTSTASLGCLSLVVQQEADVLEEAPPLNEKNRVNLHLTAEGMVLCYNYTLIFSVTDMYPIERIIFPRIKVSYLLRLARYSHSTLNFLFVERDERRSSIQDSSKGL